MDDTRDDSKQGTERPEGDHPSMRLVSIDHDEYDALADLFLGDGELAPDAFDDSGEPNHDTHTPVLQLAGELDEEASALGVIESLEKTDQHATTLMSELLGDSDETMDLVRLPEPSVELVVLGHLPVRATLWARQYACSSAKERGEVVALVRAASGSTAVDLITGREPTAVEGSSGLGGAIETMHERADRVMLRVDERHEPELLERPEVETITVLTGADEAAVVASYRLIKTIEASLHERYAQDESPRLRIAVMGATREQGEDAREKLQSAVDSFIGRPVEVVIGSGRIDATGTVNIYRDTRAHAATDIIEGLVALAHRAEHGPAGVVETRPIDIGAVQGRAIESEPRPSEPTGGKATPERADRDERTDRTDRADREDRADGSSETSPTMRAGLCALIDGVRGIETRCPKAPGVEMGIDDDGLLHLLVCDADCDAALERLYTAQNWARDHLGLLLRAEPGLRFPSSDLHTESDAVMHLISQEPAALRSIYDTPVRMYALARVRVGGVIAQVATPLN
ncbi:MAG: hypothetical protein ACF8MF_08545 [Phycisphaerales bacterium JB052]